MEMSIENAVIRGYITKEDDSEVWIKDPYATWIVKRKDIVSIADWEGVEEPFEGKPALITIRDGAEIHEIRSMKINLAARPITIEERRRMPTLRGNKQLMEIINNWCRGLGFMPKNIADISKGTTGSCYNSGTAVICAPDDCG